MPAKKKRRAVEAVQQAASEDDEEQAAGEATAATKHKRSKRPLGQGSVETAPAEDEESDEDEDEEVDDDEEELNDEDEEGATQNSNLRVWRPGIDEIEEGEELDCEPGTYDMLHKAQVEWPCLSFDVMRDELGAQRNSYPMTAYVVAGSQAENAEDNRIYVMKWSNLHRTSKDDAEEESSSSSSEDDGEKEAVLDSKSVPHPGGVNRIRSMPQASHIVATWSDSGKLFMWNLDAQKKALGKAGAKAPSTAKPLFTCDKHKEEGFALDFNPHQTGRFLSGSNDGAILLWDPVAGGWNVDHEKPFSGHLGHSVEDVHWKRIGDGKEHVFASCSSDKSVRVWDARQANRAKASVVIEEAHSADVNVCSWSPCVGELLVSASDDGGFKVWDTRNVSAGPMANFRWHRKHISSIDWHPTDETVLLVSAGDDCVTIWDMAVEDDEVGKDKMPGVEHYPAQLLFLHMGQKDPKEVKWHPQLPGVCLSTAASGFNIFKTCNM